MSTKNIIKNVMRNSMRSVMIAPAIMQTSEIDRIKSDPKYKDPLCLVPYGKKIYSQNTEDGIVIEIFNRIGTTNKTFVEFGVGTGLENNTCALLLQGWKGLWIDASHKDIMAIKKGFNKVIERGQLIVKEAFINKDNIDDLIGTSVKGEIDLLSVDIDGNDYWVYNAICCINPRVIIFEYNSKFAPPIKYCMPYDPSHIWDETDRYGASLKYYEEKLDIKGYSLVGCDPVGMNSFFVRKDLLQEKFLKPYTAERHYEPFRNHLIGYKSGFAASYRPVNDSTFEVK